MNNNWCAGKDSIALPFFHALLICDFNLLPPDFDFMVLPVEFNEFFYGEPFERPDLVLLLYRSRQHPNKRKQHPNAEQNK